MEISKNFLVKVYIYICKVHYYTKNIAVEKNDNAKKVFFQGSKKWNVPTDMLTAEHRIDKLKHCERETQPYK